MTSAAIVHALTAAQPQARYIVATVGGWPAWVYATLAWVLPQRAFDTVVLAGVVKHMH